MSTYRACTGPCQQGRLPCPSPTACRIVEPEPTEPWYALTLGESAWFWTVVVGAAAAAVFLIAYFNR